MLISISRSLDGHFFTLNGGGDYGRSSKSFVPSLAGQMREYTIRQLKDFRNQSRAETDVQAYCYWQTYCDFYGYCWTNWVCS